MDGTSQNYVFSLGTLSANTWTKITKTIPGNSNITIDDNSGSGIRINIAQWWGVNYTSSSVSTDAWQAFGGGSRFPDFTNSWGTTAGATFDLTGVQLEVGSKATSFEHRSYGDEFAKCLRYYFKPDCEGNAKQGMMGISYSANTYYIPFELPIPMRAAPTLVAEGGNHWRSRTNNVNSFDVTWTNHGTITPSNVIIQTSGGSIAAATPFWFETHSNSGCNLEFDAEL